MGVEIQYPWRLFDKRGNVVAEGTSPRENDYGDFHLNDNGYYENKETGELKNGDITYKYFDRDGNEVDFSDDTMNIVNRGSGGSSDKSRAFGEIRTSTGSGVSPAFEEANRNDKPKIENPENPQSKNPQPDTPTPPPNNGGSGGGLIGEIAKQNEILNRLVSKMGQTTGLNEISRGFGSLGKAFKSSVERLSKEVAKGANTVALNNSSNKVSAALQGVNENLAKIAEIKGDLAKISENGKGMLDIETERHEYEKTPQAIKDLDGKTVANLSPREAQTANNATQAKKNTDINNFELLESDIEDLFGDLPDITGLFNVPYSSSVDSQYTK